MANVFLINAPYTEVYSKVPTAEGLNPPLGLAYIAAYLRENGHEIKILDCEAFKIGLKDLHKYIPSDIDVLGVGSMSASVNSSNKTIEIVKERNPDCKAVMGGSHMSAIPELTLKSYPKLDYGIMGEAEETMLELVNAIEKEKDTENILGTASRAKDGNVRVNPRRSLIEDLDKMPYPAYDLLPMKKYSPPAHHTNFDGTVKLTPFSLFFSSRGCAYNCTYCASKVVWTRKMRFRSAENVLGEIDLLHQDYGVHCLEIADDIFPIEGPRLHKILDGLIERNYDLKFNCLNRVDLVRKLDTMKKIRKAGCYLMRFGVESGSEIVLKSMKKYTTKDQIRDAFKMCKEAGIPNSASLIIGHPGETRETFRETLDLMKEVQPTIAHFFIAIPLVGTELYDMAIKDNLIENPYWENWVQMPEIPVMRNESLSPHDMLELRKMAYKEFYFRPSYLIQKFLSIRNFEQIKYYLRGARAVVSLLKVKEIA